MQNKLEQAVHHFLLKSLGSGFANLRFLVALSGGRDSMALATLLLKLVPRKQIKIAHFNHATRGIESRGEQKLVEQFAKKNGLELFVGIRTGTELSEASLRNERMFFLKNTRRKTAADYILTAHHAEDQLETLFMRLMRGSGLDGLKGIPSKKGRFLRPMLECSREMITEYIKVNNIKYAEDTSNASLKYLRNRIRHELLPVFFKLSNEFGPKEKFFSRFKDTAAELRWVSLEVQEQTRFLCELFLVETPYWVRLKQSVFICWDKEWQKRVIREILHNLGAKEVTRKDTNRILKMVQKKERSLSATGNIQVSYSCGYLFFQNVQQRNLFIQPIQFQKSQDSFECLPLEITLRIKSKKIKNAEFRFNAPGDYQGTKKLKKFFLEKRIPSYERKLIPVLAKKKSNEIFWCFPDKHKEISIKKCLFPFSFL